jgi:hypothetical protein
MQPFYFGGENFLPIFLLFLLCEWIARHGCEEATVRFKELLD